MSSSSSMSSTPAPATGYVQLGNTPIVNRKRQGTFPLPLLLLVCLIPIFKTFLLDYQIRSSIEKSTGLTLTAVIITSLALTASSIYIMFGVKFSNNYDFTYIMIALIVMLVLEIVMKLMVPYFKHEVCECVDEEDVVSASESSS